jgi:hypothetical protein
LVSNRTLHGGQGNSLVVPLNSASGYLPGQTAQAINHLQVFVSKVNTLVGNRGLPSAQSHFLVNTANSTIHNWAVETDYSFIGLQLGTGEGDTRPNRQTFAVYFRPEEVLVTFASSARSDDPPTVTGRGATERTICGRSATGSAPGTMFARGHVWFSSSATLRHDGIGRARNTFDTLGSSAAAHSAGTLIPRCPPSRVGHRVPLRATHRCGRWAR